MSVPKPVDVTPWDVACIVHQENASILAATRILEARPRDESCYEIHSVRGTMTETGTGILASMGIATGDLPGALSNSQQLMYELREELKIGGADVGSVLWTWGRSQQFGSGQDGGTIYMPPEFYWDGPMFGVFQNGAGAQVGYLWTVVYRIARFSKATWPQLSRLLLPNRATKHLTFTV